MEPVCEKPLTVEVNTRITQLAHNPKEYKPENLKSVEYIIPLIEIVAEVKVRESTSKAVTEEYGRVISS